MKAKKLAIDAINIRSSGGIVHLDGILKSLILAFLSSIPLLLFNGSGVVENKNTRLKFHDPDWEVATSNDLQSGQFEL